MDRVTISGPDSDALRDEVCALLAEELPSGWAWLQSSRNSRVACRKSPTYLVYKQYLVRSLAEGMKARLRGDRAARAIAQGQILRDHGFHSPAVRCSGRCGTAVFLVFAGEAGIPLGQFIYDNWQPPLSPDRQAMKRSLLVALGTEIGRLHSAGIVHGDLRLNNILLQMPAGQPRFVLIDNERNRLFNVIPMKYIEKNLVQLGIISPRHINDRDRLCFFRAYLRTYGRFDRPVARTLRRSVWQSTLRRFEEKSYFQDFTIRNS